MEDASKSAKGRMGRQNAAVVRATKWTRTTQSDAMIKRQINVYFLPGPARKDIDECAKNNGGCQHQCVNVVGGFTCECNPGWQLGNDERTCFRVLLEITDPCEQNNGGCSHKCIFRDESGVECACNPGFDLQTDGRSCQDRNECESGDARCHGQGAKCVNEIGSYRCECQAGFRLNGQNSCIDINECENKNGDCEGTCVNTIGSYQCTCPNGRTLNQDGKTCSGGLSYTLPLINIFSDAYLADQEVKHIGNKPSRGNTFAWNWNHRTQPQKYRNCPYGRFGPECEYSCNDCGNGAVCKPDGSGCVCSPGYKGVTCHEQCRPGFWGSGCTKNCKCEAGATCDIITGICKCPPGYNGKRCEKNGCEPGKWGKNCDKLCSHECATGRCERNSGKCMCEPGYYGSRCHLTCPRGTYGEMCSKSCSAKCYSAGANFNGCNHVVSFTAK
ncbi:hypothetical protein Ciccas_000063 [Cichlidogyrus casuarinus]|uniref:EGF-like domain-containing protein n=1 Tax=Cichlidogyrus casuarinus TaxID=1844966 RepID=A0ABD2QP24_9PLAT